MAKTENLKIIRMLTGEEIIAEIVVDSGEKLSIKNPLRIVVMPNKADPQQPTVGLAPFMQFSEEKELTLNKNHVTFTATPINEFVNQYTAMFGGLVVPPASKILTP